MDSIAATTFAPFRVSNARRQHRAPNGAPTKGLPVGSGYQIHYPLKSELAAGSASGVIVTSDA